MKVACVQLCVGPNPQDNLASFDRLIRGAYAKGAKFVATPECSNFLTASAGQTKATAVMADKDLHLQTAVSLAKELEIWILIGSLILKQPESDKLLNRQFLINPSGRIQSHYDKIHLFDVQVGDGQIYAESKTYMRGAIPVCSKVGAWKLGHAICFDLRFPDLFQTLAKSGAMLIAIPAAFTQVTGKAHWHTLLRARAIETGSYVIAPAQTGTHDQGRQTYGHSLIIDPWGQILADAESEVGLIWADLALERLTEVRAAIPTLDLRQPMS